MDGLETCSRNTGANDVDPKSMSSKLEGLLEGLFIELRSGIAAREDSRAFGAMIEKRIADNWDDICKKMKVQPQARPGRRTLYDLAFRAKGTFVGVDVKTKDLEKKRYSDGGVCSVKNLLKFLVQDKGTFLVAEFGHHQLKGRKGLRVLDYIRVAPLIMLPKDIYRIENLGTGQVRFERTLNQVWDEIEWKRNLASFYSIFTALAIEHYEKVGKDAERRKRAIVSFQESGYHTCNLR